MDSNQRLGVERMCLWLVWSTLLVRTLVLVGAVDVERGTDGGANVMAYWERKLHGAMPSSIRGMVTPLSSRQAAQLLLKSNYMLPKNATAFCKAARIKCVQHIMPAKSESDTEIPVTVSYPSEGASQSDSDTEIPVTVSYQSKGGGQSDSDTEIPVTVSYQGEGGADFDTEIPITVSSQSEGGGQSDSDAEIPVTVSYQAGDIAEADSDTEIPITVSYRSEGGVQSDSDTEIPITVSYQSEADSDTEIPITVSYQSRYSEDQSDSRSQFPQHHPLRKESSQARSQALERMSPELTQGPRLLLSPPVQDIGLFFPEEALVTGRKLHVSVAIGKDMDDDERTFLPRRLAKLFPIDRPDEGSKIASLLAVSKRAMKKTIHVCEARTTKLADVKACLTSLEDLADFVSGMLQAGTPTSKAPVIVKVLDALSDARSYKFAGKSYSVLNVRALKESPDEPSVACHDMPGFPFRVFYCHYVTQSQSFAVSLEAAEDGSVHERIAICHYDTSHWNPSSPAFKQLGFKPGEGAGCHWLGYSWMGVDAWLFLRA